MKFKNLVIAFLCVVSSLPLLEGKPKKKVVIDPAAQEAARQVAQKQETVKQALALLRPEQETSCDPQKALSLVSDYADEVLGDTDSQTLPEWKIDYLMAKGKALILLDCFAEALPFFEAIVSKNIDTHIRCISRLKVAALRYALDNNDSTARQLLAESVSELAEIMVMLTVDWLDRAFLPGQKKGQNYYKIKIDKQPFVPITIHALLEFINPKGSAAMYPVAEVIFGRVDSWTQFMLGLTAGKSKKDYIRLDLVKRLVKHVELIKKSGYPAIFFDAYLQLAQKLLDGIDMTKADAQLRATCPSLVAAIKRELSLIYPDQELDLLTEAVMIHGRAFMVPGVKSLDCYGAFVSMDATLKLSLSDASARAAKLATGDRERQQFNAQAKQYEGLAEARFKEAVTMPNEAAQHEACVNYARFLIDRNRKNEAVPLLSQAVKSNRMELKTSALMLAARVYFDAANYPQTVVYLTDLLRIPHVEKSLEEASRIRIRMMVKMLAGMDRYNQPHSLPAEFGLLLSEMGGVDLKAGEEHLRRNEKEKADQKLANAVQLLNLAVRHLHDPSIDLVKAFMRLAQATANTNERESMRLYERALAVAHEIENTKTLADITVKSNRLLIAKIAKNLAKLTILQFDSLTAEQKALAVKRVVQYFTEAFTHADEIEFKAEIALILIQSLYVQGSISEAFAILLQVIHIDSTSPNFLPLKIYTAVLQFKLNQLDMAQSAANLSDASAIEALADKACLPALWCIFALQETDQAKVREYYTRAYEQSGIGNLDPVSKALAAMKLVYIMCATDMQRAVELAKEVLSIEGAMAGDVAQAHSFLALAAQTQSVLVGCEDADAYMCEHAFAAWNQTENTSARADGGLLYTRVNRTAAPEEKIEILTWVVGQDEFPTRKYQAALDVAALFFEQQKYSDALKHIMMVIESADGEFHGDAMALLKSCAESLYASRLPAALEFNECFDTLMTGSDGMATARYALCLADGNRPEDTKKVQEVLSRLSGEVRDYAISELAARADFFGASGDFANAQRYYSLIDKLTDESVSGALQQVLVTYRVMQFGEALDDQAAAVAKNAFLQLLTKLDDKASALSHLADVAYVVSFGDLKKSLRLYDLLLEAQGKDITLVAQLERACVLLLLGEDENIVQSKNELYQLSRGSVPYEIRFLAMIGHALARGLEDSDGRIESRKLFSNVVAAMKEAEFSVFSERALLMLHRLTLGRQVGNHVKANVNVVLRQMPTELVEAFDAITLDQLYQEHANKQWNALFVQRVHTLFYKFKDNELKTNIVQFMLDISGGMYHSLGGNDFSDLIIDILMPLLRMEAELPEAYAQARNNVIAVGEWWFFERQDHVRAAAIYERILTILPGAVDVQNKLSYAKLFSLEAKKLKEAKGAFKRVSADTALDEAYRVDAQLGAVVCKACKPNGSVALRRAAQKTATQFGRIAQTPGFPDQQAQARQALKAINQLDQLPRDFQLDRRGLLNAFFTGQFPNTNI